MRLLPLLLLAACAGPATPPGLTPEPRDCLRVIEEPVFAAEAGSSVEEVVLLRTTCPDTEVWLDDVSVEDLGGTFEVAGVPDLRHGPDSEVEVRVRFAPLSPGERQATLTIIASPNTEVQVPLDGVGTGPVLDTGAGPERLVDVPIGCGDTTTVPLTNRGDRPLPITGWTVEGGPAWTLVDPPALPAVLQPGDTVRVTVAFAPLDELDTRGALVVQTDHRAIGTVRLQLRGQGRALDRAVDAVLVDRSRLPLDVLFTIDRSSCNDDTNAALVDAIPALTQAARRTDVDLHLAAVAADDGCILGETVAIDASFGAASARETFATMVDQAFDLAPYGAHTERGFTLALNAASSEARAEGGCNAGFWREDAFWHIIHVSDEPEQSAMTPMTYLGRLGEGREFAERLRVHGIIGPYPDGCAAAAPGSGYYEASLSVGGVVASICDDMGDNVDALTEATLDTAEPRFQGTLDLSADPVVPTLEVALGEATLPESAWRYEAQPPRVVLTDPGAAGEGEILTARYVIQPTCPGDPGR